MKHVSILVPIGHSSLANIDGSHQIFEQVNTFLTQMGQPALFDVHLVGLSKKAVQRNGMYTIEPDVLISEVDKTDLIVIPAIHGDPIEAVAQNQAFAPWVVKQYKEGAQVASFCIGAFFLASTGLLNGK